MTDPVPSKDLTLEEALEICRKHAGWYPNIPSVSRTLVSEIERLQRRCNDVEGFIRMMGWKFDGECFGGTAPEPDAVRTLIEHIEKAGFVYSYEPVFERARAAQPPRDGWDANGSPV